MNTSSIIRVKGKTGGRTLLRLPLRYGEALGLSLVLFAEHHKGFAKILENIVFDFSPDAKEEVPFFINPVLARRLRILVPRDERSALQRVEWLRRALATHALSDAKEACAVLAAWARTRTHESPKQIIIGLAVGIIPGVTLGRLMKRETMTIIIRRDLARDLNLEVLRLVTDASHEILKNHLTRSGGNAYQLEPEVGDWFFGDRALSLYTGNPEKLKGMIKELDEVNVPYKTMLLNDRIAVVAVSPVANFASECDRFELEPLE